VTGQRDRVLPGAVLFDLDDTLFDQASWLAGAWQAVAAEAAARTGCDAAELAAVLGEIAAGGTASGGIIDRALARLGIDVAVGPLVDAFRAHAPARLEPYPGVDEALARLAAQVPLGLVTDGDCAIQQAKLDALGIAGHFRAVVLSDRLGRAHRKPDSAPFRAALAALGVPAGLSVFVGDNPVKDIAGAAALGMFTIRVRTGEYATMADTTPPGADVADAVAAVELLLGGA